MKFLFCSIDENVKSQTRKHAVGKRGKKLTPAQFIMKIAAFNAAAKLTQQR